MAISPVPPNLQPVTLALTVSPCAEAIEFHEAAFGAREVCPRTTGPDGSVAHAELRIEGTTIIVADEWPDGPTRAPTNVAAPTSVLFVSTDDVDALWERALAARAREVFPLEAQFSGDRGGRVRDPFGHQWGLGQHVEDAPDDEMEARMRAWYEDDAG
jgi:PhnB protein